jgi:Holliday junction resolvase RusA-like endonuclease
MHNITITWGLLDEYKEYYFLKYPKRRVFPIKKPIPPSLNYFISLKRMAQNSMKQQYKEFAIWLANRKGIANMRLTKAEISYKFYFGDKRRRDYDNLLLTPKLLNDGFVEAGVLVDDNGENLHISFKPFGYDKLNPRVEILLKPLEWEKNNA